MTKQRIGVLAVCLLLAAAGMGQTPPAKQMAVEKKSGGAAPAQMRHYARCKGAGVVQVNGIAPFVVNFVGPDDPGPAKKMN
jgi:hypothetical protein